MKITNILIYIVFLGLTACSISLEETSSPTATPSDSVPVVPAPAATGSTPTTSTPATPPGPASAGSATSTPTKAPALVPVSPPSTPPPVPKATITPSSPSSPPSAVSTLTVTYTDSGYAPVALTAPIGATVTFKNASSRAMWIASDVHPDHRRYSGSSLIEHCGDAAQAEKAFDACRGTNPNKVWQFKFTKPGNWNYHNHLAPSHAGVVIVR